MKVKDIAKVADEICVLVVINSDGNLIAYDYAYKYLDSGEYAMQGNLKVIHMTAGLDNTGNQRISVMVGDDADYKKKIEGWNKAYNNFEAECVAQAIIPYTAEWYSRLNKAKVDFWGEYFV